MFRFQTVGAGRVMPIILKTAPVGYGIAQISNKLLGNSCISASYTITMLPALHHNYSTKPITLLLKYFKRKVLWDSTIKGGISSTGHLLICFHFFFKTVTKDSKMENPSTKVLLCPRIFQLLVIPKMKSLELWASEKQK